MDSSIHTGTHTGPLTGLRILEFAGIGPAPFCGMLLSDLGAEVLRIDRPNGRDYDAYSVETRGRRSLVLDLKDPAAAGIALALVAQADALIEGFRPGVMERLGLGPEPALAQNPKLVYGRMTGWGQTGPYAQAPGHDINYIALSGALHAIGPPEKPAIPLNLVGDFGGGALYLAFGLLAALRHVAAGGEGQVVDCAMTDGAISLMGMIYAEHAAGRWRDARERNIIDGGAHFYNRYECADGKWIAIASIETPFYRTLLDTLDLGGDQADKADKADDALDADDADEPDAAREPASFSGDQMDQAHWPALSARLAAIFRTRPRDEWCMLLEGTEICFAPVLSLAEAPAHPHNAARGSFVEIDGVRQPAPQPRFSKTPGAVQHGPVTAGTGGKAALRDWGVDPALLDSLANGTETGGDPD